MSGFDALDDFAGPGGWDEGARMVGLRTVGIEWDHAACQTAVAAGHKRIRADVAAYPSEPFAGMPGYIASPPCQAWSMAGKRKGEMDRANCHVLADRMAQGDDSTDWTEWEDPRSPLVCQPVRRVRELRPEWVALEEVPAVLGLWEHFTRILRGWGYSTWVGVLNAADYGVPQTRQRAILMASRVGVVQPPEPTHSRDGDEGDLFGASREQWVSMARALGWTDRTDVALRNGNQANACRRGLNEPAGTLFFGGRMNAVDWVALRPSTAVCGDPRIFPPGYRGRAEHYAPDGTYLHERSGDRSVRVSTAEAAILQSFPLDYPWRGTKSKQYQQVGNAVPPLLAAHVLSALTGQALAVAA